MPRKLSIATAFTAVDRVTSVVDRIQGRVGVFSRATQRMMAPTAQASARLRSSFSRVATAAAGVTAAVGGMVAAGAAIKGTIAIGAQYEKTLDGVAAKLGNVAKGSAAYQQLEAVSRRVGATTEFSAVQAAQGLEFLAMAGFNAQQSMGALPKVVDLATASGLDLARATDIASDVLGSFDLMGKTAAETQSNLSRVMDVMAHTARSSNTTMETMFETFKQAGPVGSSLGASIEEVAAMTGRLASAGIKGSDAGTTLKNVFARLAAPAGEAASILDQLGVSATDSSNNFRPIFDVFADLEKSLDSLPSGTRAKAIEGIFGKIPLAGVNVLLKQGAADLRGYSTELGNAGGAASKMAAQMRNNASTAFAGFKSALQDVQLTGFSILQPMLRSGTKWLTRITRATGTWAKANKTVIRSGINTMVGGAVRGFRWLTGTLGTVRKMMAPATEGFRTLAQGVGQLIERIYGVVKASGLFRNMKALVGDLGQAYGLLFTKAGELINKLKDTSGPELFANALNVLFKAARVGAQLFTKVFIPVFAELKEMMLSVLGPVFDGLNWLFERMGNGLDVVLQELTKMPALTPQSPWEAPSVAGGPGTSAGGDARANLAQSLQSPQAAIIEQRRQEIRELRRTQTTESKVTLDIPNLPTGTRVRRSGPMEGATINLGSQAIGAT